MEHPTPPPLETDSTVKSIHAGGTVRVCLLSLSGEMFAVDLKNVREVFEVDAVTPVPHMPPVVAGVANLRGTIIPLIDLRRILDLPGKDEPQQFAVVLKHGSQQVGLLVDRMPEIQTVGIDDISQSPSGGHAGARPFISSTLKFEGRISGVVEVPTLLASVDT